MSTVLQSKTVAQDPLAEKLGFQQRLQTLTNKVHASKNIDEILTDLSAELCGLFFADRLTIYLTSEDKGSIISKVKTGLHSFKDIKLPINEQSVAGFVAVNKRVLNIKDVYDDAELKSHSPQLNFLKAVDAKTGYRTRQMLVAPILEAKSRELIGVVQIINTKNGQSFPQYMEEGVLQLCETLSIAFRQRQGASIVQVRGKYDALVTDAVISSEELELAQRSSRRKNLDLETVLIDEFQVKVPGTGQRPGRAFFRCGVRAVQAGSHQAAGSAAQHEPRILHDQSVGAARRQQGRHTGNDAGRRAHAYFAHGRQRLSEKQDRLLRHHATRVRRHPRSDVRRQFRPAGFRQH